MRRDFLRMLTLRGYNFVGLPAVEIYHTAKANLQYHPNHETFGFWSRALQKRRRAIISNCEG